MVVKTVNFNNNKIQNQNKTTIKVKLNAILSNAFNPLGAF